MSEPRDDTPRDARGGPVRAVLRGARAVIRYMDAIVGGQDYARFVEHLRRNHPDRPIPSEREYWRERHDAAARNPANRCC
ncbi:YbdD/YjiX family protein [Nocardia sp. BMG51109]|uniref:YbdD/YjiX family protein n=1 Tax=Nocardia sp. BMG51109 TaxID=1056816 RepID=UPI0004B359A2